MTAAEKFIQALKTNATLRNNLNTAFHNLFVAAQIVGLSEVEKKDCLEALKQYVVFDKKYDTVHIHWSS